MDQLIITEDLLKAHSPITTNTNISEFVPYVGIAQELYIEPALGTALMNELKAQVKEDNLTVLNQALILKIAPALAHFTTYQALPFHWAGIVNKGVTIKESENSKGVAIDDIAQLRRWIRNDAEALLNLTIKYLCKCKSSYPLWSPDKNYCGGCGNPGTTQFEGGIFFKK